MNCRYLESIDTLIFLAFIFTLVLTFVDSFRHTHTILSYNKIGDKNNYHRAGWHRSALVSMIIIYISISFLLSNLFDTNHRFILFSILFISMGFQYWFLHDWIFLTYTNDKGWFYVGTTDWCDKLARKIFRHPFFYWLFKLLGTIGFYLLLHFIFRQ